MSTEKEVSNALNILKKNGTKIKNITLLQCNTEYPTKFEDINLNVLKTFKKKYKIDVGLSDHSNSTVIPSAAVAMGAKVIEKHITLNKKMSGPDHKASLEPKEFKLMVQNINEVLKALGSSKKKVTSSEKKNIFIARKSIVAKKKIFKGQLFSNKNLTTKRPGNKISASKWYKLIGKKASKNYFEDDFI